MLKVCINGFRGPWSWLPAFEDFVLDSKEEVAIEIASAKEADMIFQVDKDSDYKSVYPYLDEKVVVGNMLDFAEWVRPLEENAPLQEYLKFIEKCDVFTGISNKVIEQTKELFPDKNYRLFFYPSQANMINMDRIGGKEKHFISFSRLADPGKRIQLAAEAFHQTGLAKEGYTYILVGPQAPTFTLPENVFYIGFQEHSTLMEMVSTATATLMPSIGEGLGLPAIESALCGTIPIFTDIEPMKRIWAPALAEQKFETKEELVDSLLWVSNIAKDVDEYKDIAAFNQAIAIPWDRTESFRILCDMLRGIYNAC